MKKKCQGIRQPVEQLVQLNTQGRRRKRHEQVRHELHNIGEDHRVLRVHEKGEKHLVQLAHKEGEDMLLQLVLCVDGQSRIGKLFKLSEQLLEQQHR